MKIFNSTILTSGIFAALLLSTTSCSSGDENMIEIEEVHPPSPVATSALIKELSLYNDFQ